MCVCDVQDLQLALEEARSALQEREEQLREGEQERQKQEEEREKTILELKTSLLSKEQLIEVRNRNITSANTHRLHVKVSSLQVLYMLLSPDRNLH